LKKLFLISDYPTTKKFLFICIMGICNSGKKHIDFESYPHFFKDSSSTEYNSKEGHNELNKDINVRDSLTKSNTGCMSTKTDVDRLSDTSSVRELWKYAEKLPYLPTNAKTIVTSNVDKYKVISPDSTTQSKTEGISLASIDCDTDSDETFRPMGDTDEEYGSVGCDFFQSFDGLNKRVSNRYEIGLEVLKVLIHNGANPHAMSTIGDKTALMFAVLAQDFDFVKKLVEMGVNIGHMNCHGETALGLAIETQRNDIADYLRQKDRASNRSLKWY